MAKDKEDNRDIFDKIADYVGPAALVAAGLSGVAGSKIHRAASRAKKIDRLEKPILGATEAKSSPIFGRTRSDIGMLKSQGAAISKGNSGELATYPKRRK